MSAEPAVAENLSFEDALQELEAIVKKMESGETKLEESISAYERGIALKNHCEKKLRDAQSKIEKLSIQKDGSVGLSAFEEEE
jgi:exodeoxyribonuclease VII small subunit